MFFEELRSMLARRIGVCLRPDQQNGTLQRFILSRARQLGLGSAEEYVNRLQSEPIEGDEFALLISTLTNPHTYFFRDPDQFAVLRQAAAVWRREKNRPLYLWSAGCASGEEPYSAAMVCAEAGIQAVVLATDINREALALARRGRYQPWSMRHLPAGFSERYFEPDPGGGFVVSQELRRQVTFEFHNLVKQDFPHPPRPHGGWDWIICRNVFIYFERRTIDEVGARFARCLDEAGSLMLSATEALTPRATRLQLVRAGRTFLYRWRSTCEDLGAAGEDDMPGPTSWPTSPSLVGEASWPAPPPVAAPASPATVASFEPAAPEGAPSPGTLTGQAAAHLKGGQHAAAEEVLGRLLELQPDNVAALITLGNLQLCTHRFEEAVATYNRAHQLAPLLPEIHYLQGLVYRKLGDLERALQAFRRALFLEPGFWCASYMLAGVYERLGMEARRQSNLRHTLAVLAQCPAGGLFTSTVAGLRNLDLDPGEVEAACRRAITQGR